MLLSWKDLITTLLVMGIGAVYYAQSNGIIFPFSHSVRWTILLLAVVGLTMCAFGSVVVPGEKNLWVTIASILGIVSFIITLLGLVTGAKVTVPLLTGVIVLLWLSTTIRHFINQ